MQLEPVIGLEIHVQLATQSKMFCGCDNRSELLPPNSAICPICLGHPGTLPTPNEQAVIFAIKMGLALNCQINPRLKFDRKHYFYPDLPKGYQISQFDEPICGPGKMEIEIPGSDVARDRAVIGIERAHLEEDAAKSFHGTGNESLIDFNRGGSPLVETVTRPDFKSPLEAKIFLQELRTLVRTLGISDGDMEKGHMRCDANISLRPIGDTNLYPKTEIKNLNSFRSVERALQFEITRQTEVWESTGSAPSETTTRGWNDVTQKTVPQRSKEGAQDYRYFPEPDLPPFNTSALKLLAEQDMPELPAAKRLRFKNEYGFSATDARQLVENEELGNFAEHVSSEFYDWVRSVDPETDAEQLKPKAAKLISGWLLSKYVGLLNEAGKLFTNSVVTPENFAEFLTLIYQNKINSTRAQSLLRKMIETGADPMHILEEGPAATEQPNLEKIIEEVWQANPEQIEQYKNGKTAVLQFLVGQVMKKSHGHADPLEVAELFRAKM